MAAVLDGYLDGIVMAFGALPVLARVGLYDTGGIGTGPLRSALGGAQGDAGVPVMSVVLFAPRGAACGTG